MTYAAAPEARTTCRISAWRCARSHDWNDADRVHREVRCHEFGNVGQLNDRAVERLEPEAEQSIGQGLCAMYELPVCRPAIAMNHRGPVRMVSRRASHHLRDGDALPHASLTVLLCDLVRPWNATLQHLQPPWLHAAATRAD